VTDFLQLLIIGTSLGSIYALGAVGVSLAFGILRFANFAHGALMTFGAYCALLIVRDLGMPEPMTIPLFGSGRDAVGLDVPLLFLSLLLAAGLAGIAITIGPNRLPGNLLKRSSQSPFVAGILGLALVVLLYLLIAAARDYGLFGIPTVSVGGLQLPMLVPALIFGILLTGGLAVTIDQILYRRLRRTAPVILLISSFGVALIVRSAVQIVWGPDSVVYDPRIVPNIQWLGLQASQDHLLIFGATIALVVLIYLFLQKTRLGKAMRAMSDDPDLAGVTGIDTERVVIYTWFLSGGLAAAAGIFLALDTRLNPLVGFNALLPIFAAALVGGIGRPYGAVAGGLIVGIATELSTIIMPAAYKPAVAFFFVVVILIFRPTGLFKGQ